MEGNANPNRLIVLGQHLAPQERRHQRRDALLAVDQDALARRGRTVLEAHPRVAPGDQIAHRITLVERIQKVADLGSVPDEWSLNLWDRNLRGPDPGQQDLNRLGRDGIALGGHRRRLEANGCDHGRSRGRGKNQPTAGRCRPSQGEWRAMVNERLTNLPSPG
jgi:hypothetical protein